MYAFNDNAMEDREQPISERFYCKNPFSNLCVTKKGIVKYNKLCPVEYYTNGFVTEEECKSKCKPDNCNSEGNPLSNISDNDRSSYLVLYLTFHQLLQTFKSTENTIGNFNIQKEIFKGLLKINRASPHDLRHETWLRDTQNMLLNKKMLLKILDLDPTFKILDEEIWNKLNSKINLVVEYITEYPVLIKLLMNNLQNPTRSTGDVYFSLEKFFPHEGNRWMNLDLSNNFPIEPHEFMMNLSGDIHADSDYLIKSLAPIWALNVISDVFPSRAFASLVAPFSDEDYDLFITYINDTTMYGSVVFNQNIEPILLITMYILYFDYDELESVLKWYNNNSVLLIEYFTIYEQYLLDTGGMYE